MASTARATKAPGKVAVEVVEPGPAVPPVEELWKLYREMLLIRRFEEKAGQLYGMGLIGGFCHLYIGQEAVAVGIQHTLSDKDSATATTATCSLAGWTRAG